MNIYSYDVLQLLSAHRYKSQRDLANKSRYSIGIINKAVKDLYTNNYIDKKYELTNTGSEFINSFSVNNAIILAAGYGMRTTPINIEIPKGLIKIHGEPIIERTIKQLHEAGIKEIIVVAGYMKEKYEYLIDKYNVKLIVNIDYHSKNNLHSLALASSYLSDSYIIPCDIWCESNPYCSHEFYSWYMVSNEYSPDSNICVNKKKELYISDTGGNTMIGIAHIAAYDSDTLRNQLRRLDSNSNYNTSFWETALFHMPSLHVFSRLSQTNNIVEINTYEQLREFDEKSDQVNNPVIDIICSALNSSPKDISNIKSLKKGMTNRSFLFDCNGKKYIMRIPGEGTDRLISRSNEAAVYNCLKAYDICDKIIYINAKNGYKITEYIKNARVCDPTDRNDLIKCMKKLHQFHDMNLSVKHSFNVFEQIEFYEGLRSDHDSVYQDYDSTKSHVLSLKSYIDSLCAHKSLSHIDSVYDNFLFSDQPDGTESLHMIDWEYSGMADPHIDIAMFAIYAYFDKEQIDDLIDIYFSGNCDIKTRIKIYCYVAACGLLWSNWCEYKLLLGVEFGDYSIKQYRYAKDFYRISISEMERNNIKP